MLDQMLPSLVTLTLLLCMVLWALLIDFLIHLQKRGPMPTPDAHLERRKNTSSASLSASAPQRARLTSKAGFPDLS